MIHIAATARPFWFVAQDAGSSEASQAIRRQAQDAANHFFVPVTQTSAEREVLRVTGPVYSATDSIRSERVRSSALKVIAEIRALLSHMELAAVPAMTPVHVEDGSFVVEWIFPDRRLGLTFDPVPGESGWYFVSSEQSGNVRAYGRFEGTNLEQLLHWVVRPKRSS